MVFFSGKYCQMHDETVHIKAFLGNTVWTEYKYKIWFSEKKKKTTPHSILYIGAFKYSSFVNL